MISHPASRVDNLVLTPHEHHVGPRSQIADLMIQLLGQPDVVVVEEGHKAPVAGSYALIPSTSRSRGHVIANDGDPRVFQCDYREERRCAVTGRVVDDDDLEVAVRLTLHTTHS